MQWFQEVVTFRDFDERFRQDLRRWHVIYAFLRMFDQSMTPQSHARTQIACKVDNYLADMSFSSEAVNKPALYKENDERDAAKGQDGEIFNNFCKGKVRS